jgi:D-alanyl-D-alanine carboxypeptidase (penicillin-binding protein 5/6)
VLISSTTYAYEAQSVNTKFKMSGLNVNQLQIKAKSWIIYDAVSGQIIDGDKINERVPIADFTRFMLIYMLFNEIQASKIKLTDKITLPKEVQQEIQKHTNNKNILNIKNELLVKDVVLCSLINNSQDSSLVLNYLLSKDGGNIVHNMNQEAKRLGLNNTKFANVLGEESPYHYTTAYDLAKLIQIVINNHPNNKELFTQKQFTYNTVTYTNTNNILSIDKMIDIALNSNFKNKPSFIISKERIEDNISKQKRRVISVIIDSHDIVEETQEGLRMLNYAFSEFDTIKIYDENSRIGSYKLWMGKQDSINLGIKKSVYITLPKGVSTRLSTVIDKPKYIYAPIQAGNEVGSVKWLHQGKEIYKIPVVALDTVHESNFISRWIDRVRMMFD